MFSYFIETDSIVTLDVAVCAFDDGMALTDAEMIIPMITAPIRASHCFARLDIFEFDVLR